MTVEDANFAKLRDEYAALLRAHTRAIWTLKGYTNYPDAERSEVGTHAQAVLAWASARVKT